MKTQRLAAAALLAVPGVASAGNEMSTVDVYKSPWCGCCEVWMKAIEKVGYTVKAHNMEDIEPVKRLTGVPEDMEACHTAVVKGDEPYVLEGHVPLEAMTRLFVERPSVSGLAVPGMPDGSLGMGADPTARYTVYAFAPGKEPAAYLEVGE